MEGPGQQVQKRRWGRNAIRLDVGTIERGGVRSDGEGTQRGQERAMLAVVEEERSRRKGEGGGRE